jgi:hypothetical protein
MQLQALGPAAAALQAGMQTSLAMLLLFATS